MPTWLAITHLRVDVGGVPLVDGLTFASGGNHVLVLGAARALFEAVAGLRPVTRGEVLLDGKAPLEAIRAGVAASAPRDPCLPPGWSLRRYATWSARLMGHPRGTAIALASEALERMQLTSMAKTRLAVAPLWARRALVVAAAVATGATTLLLEDPTGGLSDETAHALARTTVRAVEDRRSITFAGRVPLESPLALAADEAIVIDGSDVAAQGAPAEIAASERVFALRLVGDVESFVRAVETSGGHAIISAAAAPAARVRVELGPLAACDLLRIAATANATVLELRPLALPFA